MKDNCFICGWYRDLEKHHIFGGANRKLSEKYKLIVHLCPECHRTGKKAVHQDADTNGRLKEYGQRKFQTENPDLDFRAIFGKNHL